MVRVLADDENMAANHGNMAANHVRANLLSVGSYVPIGTASSTISDPHRVFPHIKKIF